MNIGRWIRTGICTGALVGLMGCESTSDHKGAIIGGAAGGVLGAAAGAAIGGKDHRAAGAIIGGTIGAAGGAVAGDQMVDKKKREEAEAAAKEAGQTAPAPAQGTPAQ